MTEQQVVLNFLSLIQANEKLTPIELYMFLALTVYCRPSKMGPLIHVETQKQIGPYRVDFLVTGAVFPIPKLVIECDGHDFHQLTKEQSTRDKKRDRYLQSRGYKVMRFTGSEIWKNPFSCAQEAVSLIMQESNEEIKYISN